MYRSRGDPVHGDLNAGLTLNAPPGYQPGDKLIAFFAMDGLTDDHLNITFSGWTFLNNINVSADDEQVFAYWKDATGSDSFAVSTSTAATQTTGFVAAWSGRKTGVAPSFQVSVQNTGQASPITVSLTGITATDRDDIAVYTVLDQVAQTDTWGFSQTPNYIERVDFSPGDWDSDSLQIGDGVGAGATGSIALVATQLTGVANAGWGGFVITIAAAADAFMGDANGPGFITGSPYALTGEMQTGGVELVPGASPENGQGFVTGAPLSFTGEMRTGGPEFVPGSADGPGFVTGSETAFTGEMLTGAPDTIASGHTIAIGQVVETDTAQAIAWAPKLRLVNQVVETDLAQGATHLKTRAIGQPAETDLAQPMTHRKTRALGQPSETDLAQAIARRKTKALGQTTETDLAQTLAARIKTRLLGQAAETDIAQVLARLKAKLLGQALETDFAQAFTHRKIFTLGEAQETDFAQAVTRLATGHTVVVNQAAETDLAQPIAWAPKKRLLGQASETNTAQPVGRAKQKLLGLVLEIDLSQPLTHRKTRTLGQPAETDLAQTLSRSKSRTLGQPGETDFAQAIRNPIFRTLGQAMEVDIALAIALAGVVTPGQIALADALLSGIAATDALLGSAAASDAKLGDWAGSDAGRGSVDAARASIIISESQQ